MSLPAAATSERISRPEGLVLVDKYRLGRELGSGSAGTVYEAENLAIRRRVAIKVLDAALAKTPEAVARFQREAQAAGRLGHPHLVEVLDLGMTADGVPFIVMEYLEGVTLRDVLAREGRLSVPRAVDVGLQALQVLQAAHAQGIIHRDLKPENLFLTRRGQRGDFVKVLDFGVAKFSEPGAGNLTDQGMTVGTPNYMSPEQVRGRALDARSDVYSMAVVLWEMLAGRLPHEGDNSNETMISIVTKDPPPLRAVRPDVDPRLSAVLARAMRRDPADRPGSARELAEALEPFGAAIDLTVGEDVVSPGLRAQSEAAEGADTEPVGTPRLTSERDLETEYVSAVHEAAPTGRRWLTLAAAGAVLCATAVVAVWELGGAPSAVERAAVPVPPPTSPVPLEAGRSAAVPALPRPAAPVPRPVAPLAGRRVLLQVDANVPGAFVTLDGVPLGLTPLRTEIDAAPGEHELEVSADDRAPTRQSVRLDAPVRLTVELGTLATTGRRGPRRPVDRRAPPKRPGPRGEEGTFDPFRPR